MIRLNIIAEGQTEEAFVHAVLVEPLATGGVAVSVRCVETSRDKRRAKIYRGGLLDYQRAKRDLLRWMKEDQNPEAHFTTMFDLYALPNDFPGYEEAKRLTNPSQRVNLLEAHLLKDINHRRFIPYLQLHEFEALLFTDPSKFDWEFIDHADAIQALVNLASQHGNPELIDDGEQTAPSKRIIQIIPEYEGRKASVGPLIAARIGLLALRQKCAHFHAWLEKIEALVSAT
jgi:Domain of unknown function (DUF4276)